MIIEFDIPEIPNQSNPFVGYWGSQMLIGHFSDSPRVISLSATFVRCTFSALEDYRSADEHLRAYFGSHDTIKVSESYRSVSRFESCITNVHLAIRAFGALRRRSELTAKARSVINEKKPRFISSAISDRVREVRNTIQHIEDRLANGSLEGDLTYMIQPTGPEVPVDDIEISRQTKKTIDRIKIFEHEVSFRDLAGWIGEMIQYVEKLRTLMPTSWTSTSGSTTD
ncbi:hypothetical protein P3T20_005076 [Paraburkholderia sp. GAS206C]|uniref:hypothetical protein n=1 Tax=unclassified Paraburkholderia TaxID=2615204 RepID=UPI003D1CA2EE